MSFEWGLFVGFLFGIGIAEFFHNPPWKTPVVEATERDVREELYAEMIHCLNDRKRDTAALSALLDEHARLPDFHAMRDGAVENSAILLMQYRKRN